MAFTRQTKLFLGSSCECVVNGAQIWVLAAPPSGKAADLCICIGHSAGLTAWLQLSPSCWGHDLCYWTPTSGGKSSATSILLHDPIIVVCLQAVDPATDHTSCLKLPVCLLFPTVWHEELTAPLCQAAPVLISVLWGFSGLAGSQKSLQLFPSLLCSLFLQGTFCLHCLCTLQLYLQ